MKFLKVIVLSLLVGGSQLIAATDRCADAFWANMQLSFTGQNVAIEVDTKQQPWILRLPEGIPQSDRPVWELRFKLMIELVKSETFNPSDAQLRFISQEINFYKLSDSNLREQVRYSKDIAAGLAISNSEVWKELITTIAQLRSLKNNKSSTSPEL